MGKWISESDVEGFLQREFDSNTQPSSSQLSNMIIRKEGILEGVLYSVGVASLGTISEDFIKETMLNGVAGEVLRGELSKSNPTNLQGSEVRESGLPHPGNPDQIGQQTNEYFARWARNIQELRIRPTQLLPDSSFSSYIGFPQVSDNPVVGRGRKKWSKFFNTED